MNFLRRALFPIMIGLLAFAVGIALAGGPLQADEGGDDTASLRSDNQALQDKVTALRAAGAFDEGLGQALSTKLLKHSLDGRGVTLVVLPGVDRDVVTATQDALKASGAEITAVAMVDPDLVDPGKKTYVDSVVTSSLKGAADLADVADESTYVRAGALLARAYVGKGGDANIDEEAAKIDSELQGAKLVSLDGSPLRRGTFVVVLAPGDHGSDSFTTATMVISHDLVSALVHGSDAAVIASTPTSSSSGGLIDVLSTDQALEGKRMSTVNVVDSAAGQITMIYALAAAADGEPGHYGLDGGETVLPPGVAPKAN